MNVDYGVVHGTMDNGHVMRTFFKNVPNKWPIWGLWFIWGTYVFPVELIVQSHCVSLKVS